MEWKKNNDIWIGFVGRIAAEKGLEYLVQSTYLAGRRVKRLNLVFAGPDPSKVVGENNYWHKLKKQLDAQKIDYLFFKDLTDSQLGAFYKTIDVLVLPSTNQTEAFGMVQVETMLCGTPVVATDLPGVRIPIKLTKMGLLVKPKNTRELAEAISTILNNRKKFTNDRLIDKTKKIFDPRKTYDFYEKIFGLVRIRRN
jgi:glycosyltransferase involved in cell wall biosynthesis